MNSLVKKCPMCGRVCELKLDESQLEKLIEYDNGGILIQDAFPEFNPTEREFIKLGYCPECQEMIFGNGETAKITWRSKDGR